jgi:two-component system OmpR family response regulator
MLTARGDDGDRIQGLELGADDYVPKPCTPRELTARLRSILRRTAPFDATVALSPVIVVDELSVWPQRREACCAGALLSLTGAEFNLLACMASRAGEVLGKGTLSRHALGRELNPQDRSIDVHICNLRHKLGLRADGQAWIANVRGQGYQLRST